ncbi:hypothetical protein L596_015587 [Steinernema carpocapsae]|uniref:Secreted protein n=1 Tax=Steinernema carpocapsae TaxID=34508 RepID=A0A4U5NG22_STECR|nr:hypothetical protein L596_015587 [Steinernema carpocapsae]
MSIPWIALSSLLWHIFACVTLVSFCTVKRCNCDGLGTKAKRKKKLATSSANEKPVVEHTVRISLSQTCHSSDFAAPDSTDPTQADQRLSQDTMTLDNKDGTTKTTKTEEFKSTHKLRTN